MKEAKGRAQFAQGFSDQRVPCSSSYTGTGLPGSGVCDISQVLPGVRLCPYLHSCFFTVETKALV